MRSTAAGMGWPRLALGVGMPSRATRDERIAGVAFLFVAVHLLVDAATRGRPATVTVVELAGALALAPALLALFVRRGRLGRTSIAGVTGLVALSVGIGGWAAGAVMAGRSASDVTGVGLALAGGILVALALRIALRDRRPAVQAVLALAIVFVVLQWVVSPAVTAGLVTHSPRESIPAARTLGVAGARDVTFAARDGVRLNGWYVPSRNRAAVVLLHGAHDDRASTPPYLRFLARAGYGVLAYDARGHGESGGHTNALGWRGDADLAGAVAFLRGRPDVDASRIGALGLSMGGEEALRAAAGGTPLAAVVADGAGDSTFGDQHLVSRGWLAPVYYSSSWLAMREIELLSTDEEPSPLKAIVDRIDAPTLLIASNRKHELAIDERFRARIGRNARLWYVADAGHTQAFRVHRDAYAARVTAFFAAAL